MGHGVEITIRAENSRRNHRNTIDVCEFPDVEMDPLLDPLFDEEDDPDLSPAPDDCEIGWSPLLDDFDEYERDSDDDDPSDDPSEPEYEDTAYVPRKRAAAGRAERAQFACRAADPYWTLRRTRFRARHRRAV